MNNKTRTYADELIHLADYSSHMKLKEVANGNNPYYLIESKDDKEYYYFVIPEYLDLQNIIVPMFNWFKLQDDLYLIATPKKKGYAKDLLKLVKQKKVRFLDPKKDKIIL